MIKIENIYYMLCYAYRNVHMDEMNKINYEAFDNHLDLLTEILLTGVTRQLKMGIQKDYINKEDSLTTLKGKIEITATIHRNAHINKQVVCNYDDYSINTYMNQILKATLLFILKAENISLEHKKNIRKRLIYFKGVEDIHVKKIKWSALKYHRHNVNYRFLLNICYFIIQQMILRDENGQLKVMNFVDDQAMSRLYEKFVLEYYKKHHPEFKVSSSYISWNVDDTFIDFLPVMHSDIMIEYENNILIIDTKYYSHMMQNNRYNDKKTLHSNNLYQIFTYVKNKDNDDEKKVSGMLLYAKTDEEISPNYKYEMSGNTIFIKNLDLNKSFSSICTQLEQICSCLYFS